MSQRRLVTPHDYHNYLYVSFDRQPCFKSNRNSKVTLTLNTEITSIVMLLSDNSNTTLNAGAISRIKAIWLCRFRSQNVKGGGISYDIEYFLNPNCNPKVTLALNLDRQRGGG